MAVHDGDECPQKKRWRRDEDPLWQTIGASLQLYRAMVAVISLFMGFVFTILTVVLRPEILEPLSRQETSEGARGIDYLVYPLAAAFVSFHFALLLLHGVAHQVVRYWEIFYPDSGLETWGTLLFGVGIMFMYIALGLMVLEESLPFAVLLFALGVVTPLAFRQIKKIIPDDHYRRDVRIKGSRRSEHMVANESEQTNTMAELGKIHTDLNEFRSEVTQRLDRIEDLLKAE